jgi:hypothetical protein
MCVVDLDDADFEACFSDVREVKSELGRVLRRVGNPHLKGEMWDTRFFGCEEAI